MNNYVIRNNINKISTPHLRIIPPYSAVSEIPQKKKKKSNEMIVVLI